LGGSDSDDNCVNLTYKEHYLAHWILTRITEEPHRYKMLRAFFFMSLSCGGTRKVGGWQYALSKKAASEAQVGKTPAKGHKHTPEWRKQKSLYLMGNDHAKGKNLGNNGSRGHTWTLSQVKRENIRVRMLGKQQALNYIWKEEQVEKISGENHHSAKSVKCLNDNKIYPTQTSAARNYGLYQADVSVSCRLNKTVKGFRFEFT
jgi:hypothetical protein